MNNCNNKNVTKDIGRLNNKECSNSSADQKTIDNLKIKRLNILEIEMNDVFEKARSSFENRDVSCRG